MDPVGFCFFSLKLRYSHELYVNMSMVPVNGVIGMFFLGIQVTTSLHDISGPLKRETSHLDYVWKDTL